MSVKRPVALVTGASRGIGKAIAGYFAEQQYDLILVARNEGLLTDVGDTLHQSFGVQVTCVAADVTDFDRLSETLQPELENGLDVLVNAAGIFRFGTSILSNQDFQDMLNTNVLAAHNLSTLCADSLKKNAQAHVFNVSSIAGIEGFAPIGGYAASKFALLGYGQSLGKELLADNVRVTTLCPDVVNTDMAAGSGLQPAQMIDTDDIAKTIQYVMSLSPAAVVDQVVIKCKTILEMTDVRK